MKKVRVFAISQLAFVLLFIVMNVTLFLLAQFGVFDSITANQELEEGMALLVGVIFYIYFLIAAAIAALLIIVESILLLTLSKKERVARILLLIFGILKIVISALGIIWNIIMYASGLLPFGLLVSFFILGLLAMAIVGFIFRKSEKIESATIEVIELEEELPQDQI